MWTTITDANGDQLLMFQCFDAVGWMAGKGIRPVKTEW